MSSSFRGQGKGDMSKSPMADGMRRKREIVEKLKAGLKKLEDKYGLFSDSAKIIREDRDRRG